MRPALIASILAVAFTAQAAPAQTTAPAEAAIADQPNKVRGDEITPAQREAVATGLKWLAEHQNPDGSFGGGTLGHHAGITALAGLAFMQGGNLPERGEYGERVRKAMEFVLSCCQESGLINSDQGGGPMYGHGFATLFLGEIYGMTGNEQVKERLQRAVVLIEKSQNADGGWRYQPVPFDADISVTICQIMALRAARDAGIKVQKEVIDKSIKYVRDCQNPDGGFSYMISRGGSAFPRSAAGVASLYYAGVFDGPDLTRGLQYVAQYVPGGKQAAPGNDAHYYYGHYYAVQAMFLAGGDYWAKWYPGIRDELIARQDKTSGAWNSNVSPDYATAMSLIILQMPNRDLPVYTGKGPGS
jgi:hypothetical protein